MIAVATTPEVVNVLFLSSTGLWFGDVPIALPYTFRIYQPALHLEGEPDAKPRLRLFLKADASSYVEQERESL